MLRDDVKKLTTGLDELYTRANNLKTSESLFEQLRVRVLDSIELLEEYQQFLTKMNRTVEYDAIQKVVISLKNGVSTIPDKVSI